MSFIAHIRIQRTRRLLRGNGWSHIKFFKSAVFDGYNCTDGHLRNVWAEL